MFIFVGGYFLLIEIIKTKNLIGPKVLILSTPTILRVSALVCLYIIYLLKRVDDQFPIKLYPI